jgi:hypothetical protein
VPRSCSPPATSYCLAIAGISDGLLLPVVASLLKRDPPSHHAAASRGVRAYLHPCATPPSHSDAAWTLRYPVAGRMPGVGWRPVCAVLPVRTAAAPVRPLRFPAKPNRQPTGTCQERPVCPMMRTHGERMRAHGVMAGVMAHVGRPVPGRVSAARRHNASSWCSMDPRGLCRVFCRT